MSTLHLQITPWAIRDLLRWVKTKYNIGKIYVTENGYIDGNLEDNSRILYLQVNIRNHKTFPNNTFLFCHLIIRVI